jgi:hypothetical protein
MAAKATINAGPAAVSIGNNIGRLSNISGAKTRSESNRERGGFKYIINSMLMISIVGMCIKIFFSTELTENGLSGPANAVIYGYGIVALAIITLLFISYGIHDRVENIENRGKANDVKGKLVNIMLFIKSFLTSSGPSILTILVLGWIISLNISYYKKINKGMVASEFYQLSSGTTFLFVFQIICLFQYLKLFIDGKTEKKDQSKEGIEKMEKNESTKSRIAFATYFITTINLVIVGMMTIILQFFSTDG